MSYQFTVLVAIYNVEKYLPAFLRSLDNQIYNINDVEIIAVDDGSTDQSASLFIEWSKQRSNVTLLKQENAGPGAARATALKQATGAWVTVADPDDVLDREYFAAVADFIDRDTREASALLETRVYILNDSTGEFKDTHPLGKKFRYGDRLTRLSDEPEAFQLGATAFFRRDVLLDNGLNYDPYIRPTFEDAHLIGRYLNCFDDPIVGLVSRAHYYYRKRAAANSLVQSSWGSVDRFLNTPVRGYLNMLLSITSNGKVPVWAQYMVLYDLLWYFKEDQNMISKASWISEDVRIRFLATVAEIMSYISEETISRFPCNPHPWVLRQSLLLKYSKTPIRRTAAYKWSTDDFGRLHLSVLYSGPRPDIRVYGDGRLVESPHIDYTSHRFFGEVFITEESWAIHADEVSVFVDGAVCPFRKVVNPVWTRPSANEDLGLSKPVLRVGNNFNSKASKISRRVEINALTTSRTRAAVMGIKSVNAFRRVIDSKIGPSHTRRVEENKNYAGTLGVRSKYRDCWLVMDRPYKADDNGEHLYRYLMFNCPHINSFFVLSKSSPDWHRLEAEGFRLLDYGSREMIAAFLNSSFRLSSDATADVMYHAPRTDYGVPPGKFIFLQHGVTMNDLSRWLNPKTIDLIICATPAERAAFVDKHSYYKLRSHNVALTGFARYDELARRHAISSKSSILVMPTWRSEVRDKLQDVDESRRLGVLETTEYGMKWLAFLRSTELLELTKVHGVNVQVVIHPSLDRLIPNLNLPPGVNRVDIAASSFQQLITGARVFVTDYSSLAFDAAYINTPTVYYQFDKKAFFSGSHNYRDGYFDYERDGFGPISTSRKQTIENLDAILSNRANMHEYYSRISRTFVWQDSHNCARIVSAIENI